jgi:hypothetical protein
MVFADVVRNREKSANLTTLSQLQMRSSVLQPWSCFWQGFWHVTNLLFRLDALPYLIFIRAKRPQRRLASLAHIKWDMGDNDNAQYDVYGPQVSLTPSFLMKNNQPAPAQEPSLSMPMIPSPNVQLQPVIFCSCFSVLLYGDFLNTKTKF